MPSPPSTPPRRSLRLETDFADAKHGRSWETCADEPSHRLFPTTLNRSDQRENRRTDPLLVPKPRDHSARYAWDESSDSSSSDSLSPIFENSLASGDTPDEHSGPSSQPQISPVSSFISSFSASSSSSSSSPFDWRVGRAGRGATGTRYRVSERTEKPTPIPIPLHATLTPTAVAQSVVGSSVTVKIEDDEDQAPTLVITPTHSSTTTSPSLAPSNSDPTVVLPSLRHMLLPRDRAEFGFQRPAMNSPFAASPFAPLPLSSPFYPSSRRSSIDSDASSASTPSTISSFGPYMHPARHH